MILFGIEIRKYQPPAKEPLTPLDRMKDACDDMNDAWTDYRAESKGRIRPWVIWNENRVVLSEYSGAPIIFHE